MSKHSTCILEVLVACYDMNTYCFIINEQINLHFDLLDILYIIDLSIINKPILDIKKDGKILTRTLFLKTPENLKIYKSDRRLQITYIKRYNK